MLIINHLHSTMYLLNLRSGTESNVRAYEFTFHYVSIKSEYNPQISLTVAEFTFHYVSIKSQTTDSLWQR